MANLIIVRHGQSDWNLKNLFTGEEDVDLTPAGIEEAKHAGSLIKQYPIDYAYTSVLQRAIHTLEIMLTVMGKPDLPVTKNKAFNERNYGDLQGLNKAETIAKYGDAQVLLWRRSFEAHPPNGESLEDTYNRVIPYYDKEIVPRLSNGKHILIAAHGNSLRALMMYLEHISREEIANVNLATGAPKMYQFDDNMKLIKTFYIT